MSWKLFGISMLIMKILVMELLNMQIKSKIQQPTRHNNRPRERSDVITPFQGDAIVYGIFQPDFTTHMGVLCSVNTLLVCKRCGLSTSFRLTLWKVWTPHQRRKENIARDQEPPSISKRQPRSSHEFCCLCTANRDMCGKFSLLSLQPSSTF